MINSYNKMKIRNKGLKGFTLVELLIVIALIAILSVAVLATINPIEQANKAKDSTVMNDAAEVLNAYERYYAAQSSYPWIDVTSPASGTVDSAIALTSDMVGFGLCTNGTITANSDVCSPRDSQGLLISTTELKDSFLAKNYTKDPTNPVNPPTFKDMLYIVKQPVANGNSIYVCFIPKAKANRTANSKLRELTIDANTHTASVFRDAPATDFTGGYPTAAWDFTGPETSLFKCVP